MLIAVPYTAVCLVVWFLSMGLRRNYNGLFESRTVRPLREPVFVIVLLIVLAFSGFRHIEAPAVDEWIYRPRIEFFRGISFGEALRMIYAPMLSIMYWIGAKLFSTDQGSILISALFSIPPLLIGMRKHCFDFSTGIVMLFLTGFIATSFNGVAQCIATAVFVCFFENVYERKFWKHCAVILLCFLFHSASLVLFFFYFYANTRHGEKKNFLYSAIFLILVVVVYRAIPVYGNALGLDDYVDVVSEGHHGVRTLSIIVSMCPAVLSLWLCKKVGGYDNVTNAVANIVLLHGLLALTSSIDVYIARFQLFTAPFIAIFFSRAKYYLGENRKWLIPIGIAYYVVFLVTYQLEYYFFNFMF